uniref:Uncharacterized protein n=1 Tax=Pristionchus pacificus TaxID=54126 RepID=A0A2A6BXA5_PRIPA
MNAELEVCAPPSFFLVHPSAMGARSQSKRSAPAPTLTAIKEVLSMETRSRVDPFEGFVVFSDIVRQRRMR